MKYIKKFEKNKKDYKFKKGDYVVSLVYGRKGVIKGISRFDYNEYYLEEYKGVYFKEERLRFMTPEEIEEFKLKKVSDKFNI